MREEKSMSVFNLWELSKDQWGSYPISTFCHEISAPFVPLIYIFFARCVMQNCLWEAFAAFSDTTAVLDKWHVKRFSDSCQCWIALLCSILYLDFCSSLYMYFYWETLHIQKTIDLLNVQVFLDGTKKIIINMNLICMIKFMSYLKKCLKIDSESLKSIALRMRKFMT